LNGPVLAVLSYHKIGSPSPGGWDTWYYVPTETFRHHLEFLVDDGWQLLDLEGALAGLAEPDLLPDRAALLTFDDGYRSSRTEALPVMRSFSCPGVLFVPTDYIGRCNEFDAGSEPEEAICDWEDLSQLEQCGVAVEAHGVSHRRMSELTRAEQNAELRRSREVLEAGLGGRIRAFAFPYGDGGDDRDAMRRALKRAGYQAAFLYGGGPVLMKSADRFMLPRLAMGPDTDLPALLGRS
jgi:peptidoglycan/xylan/chitin deacetylase (PgdA/CDA1 family)